MKNIIMVLTLFLGLAFSGDSHADMKGEYTRVGEYKHIIFSDGVTSCGDNFKELTATELRPVTTMSVRQKFVGLFDGDGNRRHTAKISERTPSSIFSSYVVDKGDSRKIVYAVMVQEYNGMYIQALSRLMIYKGDLVCEDSFVTKYKKEKKLH